MRHLAGMILVLAGLTWSAAGPPAADGDPPPVAVKAEVRPAQAPAGSDVRIRVVLMPQEGIKLNRYPKIHLRLLGPEAVVAPAEVRVGRDAPPPPDALDSNYFEKPPELVLDSRVSPTAPAGEHTLSGSVKYFYCVSASGYCAPATAAFHVRFKVSAEP